MKTKYPKMMIIGLDGATLNLILPWAKEGKLPNIARLLAEGVHGYLESAIPPVTPPAWSSFMTGKNPGKHGHFHFIEPVPKSYEIRYTNALSRKSQTIWKILNDAKMTVGVINVPFTFPPEPVSGYMISGMDTPDEKSDFVYPLSIRKELEAQCGELLLDIRYLGYMINDDRRNEVLRGLEAIDEQRTKAATYLLEHHPTDVVMLAYTSTDTAQHYFWHYMDPQHYLHDAQGAEKFKNAILNVYQRLDKTIGAFLSKLPEETIVMLVSDHGAGPTTDRALSLNRYLSQLGFLKFKSDGTKKGRVNTALQAVVRSLDTLLKGNLSSRQKTQLARIFPGLRRTWESYSSALTSIDWAETKAYCVEILSSPPAVFINQKGVKPQGTVEKGAEYDALITLIIQKLYDLKDPKTGQQLISKVYRREEIYKGPYTDQAPDITLAWWEGGTFNSKPSGSGGMGLPPVGLLQNTVGPKSEWSGNHLLHGTLILKGGPFKAGLNLKQARIIDIAPTLLHLLGVPIPDDMDGQVLTEAFTDDFLSSRSVQYQKGDASPVHQGDQDPYSKEDAARVQERLKDLGYLE